jgi:hypothetical protein
MVLIVAAIALFAPWYSVTTSQVVPQTQSYTTQFTIPTTTAQTQTVPQMQTVYVLPNAVTIPAADPNQPVPSYDPQWISPDFNLHAGSIVSVTTTCFCVIQMRSDFLPFQGIGITQNGASLYVSNSVVPKSGPYVLWVWSISLSPVTLSFSVAESVVGSVEVTQILTTQTVTQTLATYSITSVTQSSQTTISPYTTFGLTTSATVLALLALIVALSIVFERQKRQPTT